MNDRTFRGACARLVFAIVCTAAVRVHAADDTVLGSPIEPLLERYCLDCHDTDTSEADIDLTLARSQEDILRHRRTWQRALQVLQADRMPPEDMPQPSSAERTRMSQWIRDTLNDVDWERVKSPGRVALARLTRTEYENTVADLFGVAVEVSNVLPDDPEGLSGFVNDRASMVMTDKHLEAYFRAADLVTDSVLDRQKSSGGTIRYEVESGENASFGKQATKRGDGSVGWVFTSALGQKYQSVRKAIDFPLTGVYRVRVKAGSTGPGPAAGMWIAADSVNDASREAGVLVEGKEQAIYEAKMFLTEGRHDILFGYDFYRPLWLPAVPTRPQMKLGQSTFDPPPYDHGALLPEGVSWEELVELAGEPTPDAEPRIRELMRIVNDGYYREVLDRLMRDQFHYTRGFLPVFVGGLGYDYQNKVVPAFEKMATLLKVERNDLERLWKSHETPLFHELEEISAKQRAAWSDQDQSRKAAVGGLFVDWIEFDPLDLPDGSIVLPEDERGVNRFLARLLPRALRRPAPIDKQKRYRSIYSDQRRLGASHQEALRRVLVTILVSPDFLYRFEGRTTADVQRLDDYALASRLSYFLWSTMPDEPLSESARQGRLQTDEGIRRQVDRMLDDKRISRLARHFTQQWLDLSGIGREKEPDRELFRYFSWHLAEDMRREVALAFERILREDRTILELLDSDETFLNERLSRLYAIEGVTGAEMRPVALTDRNRGGVLGTAAVLTATSLATRTSPVRRGTFVLETLLGVELPPPPPGVGNLSEDAGQNEKTSLREALAAHRDNPRCAGCHSKIDPLGFALENFDWLGRWRTNDPAGPVDHRGRLSDGTELDGAAALKTYLIRHRKDDFTRALAESMVAYALGRELEYYDEYAVRRIVAAVRADQYRARTLVKEIALSYPFCYRAGE